MTLNFGRIFLQSHVVKQLRQELMNKAEFRGEVHMQCYTNLHTSNMLFNFTRNQLFNTVKCYLT